MENRRSQRISEAILLGMVCLAPWAFGAAEAWAEFLLYVGVALLALLATFTGWSAERGRGLRCLPSLALGGLAVLALVQAVPLSTEALKRISPATSSLRAGLTPRVSERVVTDPGPKVALPAPTISQNPSASLETAARLAVGWVLFQSVISLARGGAPLRRFGIAIASNATLLALFSLVQMLTWNGKIYWLRESPSGNGGPFVCHNHLAAYLNLGLGFALAFLLTPASADHRRKRRGERVWAAYAVGVIIVGVIASLSRSGFLAMTATMVLAIITLRPKAMRIGVALAGVVVLIPLFLFALGTTATYQQRITSIADPDASSSVRLQIWRRAIRIWPSYPVFGTGLGSYPVASVRFFVNDSDEYFLHAENEYLEWLVEAGAVGFGLIVLAVVGTVRLAQQALKGVSDPADRAMSLGALFGLFTLLIHSIGDFAFHMPAVAIVAIVSAAHLAKRGLEAGARASDPPVAWSGRLTGIALGLGMLALSGIIVVQGWRRMAAESFCAEAGIQNYGRRVPLAADRDAGSTELQRMEDLLGLALRSRPNWAEGHLRLGLIYLRLYELSVREGLMESVKDPEEREMLAKPGWLFKEMHPLGGRKPIPMSELLDVNDVREYLVPAARSFLEARRCCPVLSQPHSRLAMLDFLLQGGDSPSVYLDRALRLAGSNRNLLAFTQQMALQTGDIALLSRCWKEQLHLEGENWEEIADLAREIMSPDQILSRVIPSGRYALLFASRLYPAPEDRAIREDYLREAIRRLPHDARPSLAERYQLEAEAWSQLGDREKAQQRMEQALVLEPRRADWRKELVDWLIGWGRPREAHDQALVGLYFAPDHPDTNIAREHAAEALSRNERTPTSTTLHQAP